MTLRFLLATFETISPLCNQISQLLRFPALAGTTVTFTIWWTILFPLIYSFSDDHRRKEFLKFNTSFLLINLHFLNMPLCVIEFLLTRHSLYFYDLWVGFLVAFLYMLFYLNILDPRGIHVYIILTPRTSFCIVSYSLVVGVYVSCYYGWNYGLSLWDILYMK
jgi:hypothetical protein